MELPIMFWCDDTDKLVIYFPNLCVAFRCSLKFLPCLLLTYKSCLKIYNLSLKLSAHQNGSLSFPFFLLALNFFFYQQCYSRAIPMFSSSCKYVYAD